MDKLAKTCARVCYYTYHPDQATDIGEWRVHSKSDRIIVYINKITFAVIIGVRGSKDMDDIKTDVRLLAGSQTISDTQPYLRLKSVLATGTIPIDLKIVLTGHSLGGLVCLYEFLQFRLKNIVKCIVFNPYIPPNSGIISMLQNLPTNRRAMLGIYATKEDTASIYIRDVRGINITYMPFKNKKIRGLASVLGTGLGVKLAEIAEAHSIRNFI